MDPRPPGGVSVAPAASPLVGRERELATVRELLDSSRLVTITGPGGVGKTRLAREVVARHVPPPPATVCELVPVPDCGGVVGTVSEALGFPTLLAAVVGIGSRPRLLVVDNVEHHLDVVAEVLERLLAECPGLTVLTTSREPLDLPNEHVVVLDGLDVPPGDDPVSAEASPAVQLFAMRARAAGATLTLDTGTTSTIAAICRRLDGLPLAIELAAARARTLTPADIARHLDARFELLTRRHDRGDARHRTLEAAIDWSYERLDPTTQAFFAQLGTFCGPFDAETANAVVGGDPADLLVTIDRLDALVTRSLATTTETHGRTTYNLPESVRLYARRRLEESGELDELDERCVTSLVTASAALADRARRSWSLEVFGALQVSRLNVEDAIRWCLAHDVTADRAFTLFVPLWGLIHNGRAETVHGFGESLLERWPDPEHERWVEVAATTATAAIMSGARERGTALADTAIRLADGGLGYVLAARAAAMAADDAGRSLAILDGGIAEARASGLQPFAAELGIIAALTQGRTAGRATALGRLAELRPLVTAADSPLLDVFADIAVGALSAMDDTTAAERVLGRAAALARDIRYPWGVGVSHRALAAVALLQGDSAAARRHLTRSLEAFVGVGQLAEAAATLRWIAAFLAANGMVDEAGVVCPVTVPHGLPALAVLEAELLAPMLADVVPTASVDDLRPALAAAHHGLEALRERSTATPPTTSACRWVSEGGVWALTYAGRTVRLPASKGLADLAVLLARPAREVAAAELMGVAVDSADLGPVVDRQARQAYERRIRELQAEIDEAEGLTDAGQTERAREELDRIVDVLVAATDRGGRSRRSGSSIERARSAVTWRIRDAIRRIREVHPELGEHLAAAVRTGRWCAYEPTTAVGWHVEPGT